MHRRLVYFSSGVLYLFTARRFHGKEFLASKKEPGFPPKSAFFLFSFSLFLLSLLDFGGGILQRISDTDDPMYKKTTQQQQTNNIINDDDKQPFWGICNCGDCFGTSFLALDWSWFAGLIDGTFLSRDCRSSGAVHRKVAWE